MPQIRVGPAPAPVTGQRAVQAATAKQRELVRMEERECEEDALPETAPPRVRDCDEGRPSADHSWRPSLSPLIEAVLVKRPVARWYVDDDLQVHSLVASVLKVQVDEAALLDDFDQARREVLQAYVHHQSEFIRTGNPMCLEAFKARPSDCERMFSSACLERLKIQRPTDLLEGQYFYLPNGALCAARLLHSAEERSALTRVLKAEETVVAHGGKAFSQANLAEEMTAELGYSFSRNQVEYLLKKMGIPSSSHKRRKSYA